MSVSSRYISIHALRKESDAFVTASCNTITISIHALRKESDNDGIGGAFASPISIHALRKESDQDGAHNVKQAKEFQSTLSVRRATQMDGAIVRLVVISIHALRKESD